MAEGILTAGRIGWTFESAHQVRTAEGRLLDLKRDSPADVKHCAKAAVSSWRAANILENFTATRNLVHPRVQPQSQQVVPVLHCTAAVAGPCA